MVRARAGHAADDRGRRATRTPGPVARLCARCAPHRPGPRPRSCCPGDARCTRGSARSPSTGRSRSSRRSGWCASSTRKTAARPTRPRRTRHGHYVICRQCRRAAEFEGCAVESALGRVTAQTGYRVSGHWLELFGLCPDCQRKGRMEGHEDETAASGRVAALLPSRHAPDPPRPSPAAKARRRRRSVLAVETFLADIAQQVAGTGSRSRPHAHGRRPAQLRAHSAGRLDGAREPAAHRERRGHGGLPSRGSLRARAGSDGGRGIGRPHPEDVGR